MTHYTITDDATGLVVWRGGAPSALDALNAYMDVVQVAPYPADGIDPEAVDEDGRLWYSSPDGSIDATYSNTNLHVAVATHPDYVNHEALTASSVTDLREVVAAGGPAELIAAATAELASRGVKGIPEDRDADVDRVVLTLTAGDAETLADSLALLRDIVEDNDPHNDEWHDTLVRLERRIRAELEGRS